MYAHVYTVYIYENKDISIIKSKLRIRMLTINHLAKKGMFNLSMKPRATQLLINGKFVDSASGKTFDTHNPATEEKVASV